MKWFGNPWPSEELRAAVCENEADRVPVPVGEECTLCTEEIMQDDRGIVMSHLALDPTDDRLARVEERAAHLDCLIRNVGG